MDQQKCRLKSRIFTQLQILLNQLRMLNAISISQARNGSVSLLKMLILLLRESLWLSILSMMLGLFRTFFQ